MVSLGRKVIISVGVIFLLSLAVAGCQDSSAPSKKTPEAEKTATGLEQNCSECHRDFDASTKDSKELIFSHDLHKRKGSKCPDCHVKRVHTPDKTVTPSMQTCYKCHGLSEKAKATGECAACHPAGFELKPEDHLASNFLPPKHAEKAQGEKEYCDMCHQSSFCLDCHGMEMPHPAEFEDKHAEQAKKGIASCTNCHKDISSCSACHHKGSKPDVAWVDQHPDMVKQKGGHSCFGCHDPKYCAHCHITGQKPTSIKGP